MLARLAVKWSIPSECLAEELPRVHQLVQSRDWAEVSFEDDGEAEDGRNGARDLFFFQLPLGDDNIELVDSLQAYEKACESLKVSQGMISGELWVR